MAKQNADTNYNTNLASEYLMMSLLCRAGKDAYLSLGNKKGVDIIIKTDKGAICIVEVKGINGYNWPISTNGSIIKSPNLFYAFVSFNKKITELMSMPDFWLIPSELLAENNKHKTVDTKKTVNVTRKHIIENYNEYKNTFKFLDIYLNNN
jgi:formylmethanofuran dehydrogenase subunit D